MTMKPTHFSHYMRFALLFAMLCSFATTTAYDFEVDGIYYNKTSATTVEVTYKDSNYASYSGEVIIPSTVTRNGTSYSVITIGDSAFYNSNVYSITIPETVSSIGEQSLIYDCTITCLAHIPPCVKETSFGDFSGYVEGYELKPNLYVMSGSENLVFVNQNALENYKNTLWDQVFFICSIGAESTETPTIEMNMYYESDIARGVDAVINGVGTVFVSYYITNNPNYGWDIPPTCWEERYYVSYYASNNYDYDPTVSCLSVSAFAYEYGKLPSNIVNTFSDPIYSYTTVPDPDAELVRAFDVEVDSICYNLNGSFASVAPDLYVHKYEDPNFDSREVSLFRYLYQEVKDIIIPSTINYNGTIYTVDKIEDYTFGSTMLGYNFLEGLGIDYSYYLFNGYVDFCLLEKVVIPNTVTSIGCQAFNNCMVSYLSIPNSVTSMDLTSDYEYWEGWEDMGLIYRIHLTGEGEWSGASLGIPVYQLDISSGLTTLPGLKVNPREVYCYAKVPPTCDENTFTDYTGTLHVPESSLAAYFTAPYWCNFANIVGDAVELTDLTLNKDSAELLVDEQLTLNATIQPTNANIDSITWESSNPSVATVTSDGVVTAKALGKCDIIVTCLDKRAICHIKVVEQVTTITLDQHRASLLPNHILTLTPTITPEPTDLVVTSSNPSVAAARLANGKVQVVGVSVGTAIIKVASVDGNAVADSCFVNVYTEAGDVDGDGFVKIDDVTALIDHLLGSNSSIDVGNADINYDGVVSIADVTELIDYLLGGSASMSSRETFTVNGVSFTMIRVPAGSFMMGATEEQGSDANSWEKPVHEVTLTSSYLIGETEVTQELWLAVMGTNPSKHEGSLQKPVENVSWLDCQEFISQLNALTGLTFRMPTEAEWEYAARGANRSRGYKYAGSNNIADVGNVSSSTTMPVGSLQPNELNLYDMSGNVDEWVWDLFGYYTSEPQIDPTGPADGGSDHMYRGGSWYSGANTARVSYRFFRASTFKRGTMGLRLAL